MTHASEPHETHEVDGHGTTAVASAPAGPLFDDADLHDFDRDDVKAGGAIGKMLSLFFLYTVIAMSIVGCWTFAAVDGK